MKKRIDSHGNVVAVRQDGIGGPQVSESLFLPFSFLFPIQVIASISCTTLGPDALAFEATLFSWYSSFICRMFT